MTRYDFSYKRFACAFDQEFIIIACAFKYSCSIDMTSLSQVISEVELVDFMKDSKVQPQIEEMGKCVQNSEFVECQVQMWEIILITINA